MVRINLKLGDIVEIPLPNRKKVFAQFVFRDNWGDMIRIWDHFIDQGEKIKLDDLKNKSFLFGPILTRVRVGMKLPEYNWKVVGNLPVEKFEYPNFIWKEGGPLTKGKVTKWYLYDGKKNTEIGKKLPKQYKSLEYMSNHAPRSVIDRVLYGKNPDIELINSD